MFFELQSKNARMLDKFLGIVESETVSMHFTPEGITLGLLKNDMSICANIKLDKNFFTTFTYNESMCNDTQNVIIQKRRIVYHDEYNGSVTTARFCIPFIVFYKLDMKTCKAYFNEQHLNLHYEYNYEVTSTKTCVYIDGMNLELNYKFGSLIKIDLKLFKYLLTKFRSKFTNITISNDFMEWIVSNNKIKINLGTTINEKLLIKVSWLHLKKLFHFINYEVGYISISENNELIKVIFQRNNVLIEVYLSNYSGNCANISE